ncbi:MAG: serine hydrolase, partial [bacterium]|nr:serine hydrolase [bacterium]
MKQFKLFFIITLVILCFGNVAVEAQQEDSRFQQAYEVIDRYVKQHMEEAGTPGLAISLTTRDSLLRVSGYGFADIKTRMPVTPDTLWEIGSVTKSFIGVSLMQLRDEGKFDPNVPVNKYLPWFRVKTKFEPITAHHLLTHTAGIPSNRDDIPSSMFMPWALRYQSTGYAPGKRFHYSNTGYQTLHFLLEKLRGESFSETAVKRLFQPLGMDSSRAVIDHDIRKRLAVGYLSFYDDRPAHRSHSLVEGTWLTYGIGDGCIVSSPADMAAYMRMLLNRGKGPNGRILSEEGFNTFSSPFAKDGQEMHYGYGIDSRKVNGSNCLMHSGGMVGYTCFLVCDMDNGLGVMVFLNGPGRGARVAMFALRALSAALHKKRMPVVPAPFDPVKVADAADYAGTYKSPDGRELTFIAEGGRLILAYKEQRVILEKRRKDVFYVNHPDFALFLLTFGRDKKKIVEVSHGEDWYTNTGYAGPRVFKYPKRWNAYAGHYRTQNPWLSNFRILVRKGKLYLVTSAGPESGEGEIVLNEVKRGKRGIFKIGRGGMPERIKFDTIVEGRALRANYSGVDFYRYAPGPHSTAKKF